MRLKILLLMTLLLVPVVSAGSGHMKLLTVGGVGNNTQGGVADLYLKVKPGTGTIFIDTFPLTKLDTQISTRFANEIACDFLDKDCSKYDFFYTIRAKASIVGGPSAGAAITILTISVLNGDRLDDNAVITGTINSGGLIGPVGGVDEKVQAAIRNGYTKILIPKWQSEINLTKIQEMGLDKKITVVKVKNLEEALYQFTGKTYTKPVGNITVSKQYSERMKEVSDILCNRSQEILSDIDIEKTRNPSNPTTAVNDNSSNQSNMDIAMQYLNRSEGALKSGDYYSRASYCFSANIRLRQIELNRSDDETLKRDYISISRNIGEVLNKTKSHELKTLSDLETYMVVRERISEASDYMSDIEYNNISSDDLAYAQERLFSAVAWSKFFDMPGKEITLEEDHLRSACLKKMAEAQERIDYVELYLPGLLGDVKDELQDASNNFDNGEYALCIFKSTKAKSEANVLLTAITIKEDNLKKVLQEKFDSIKRVIYDQESRDMFPILGYSYYEYSKSLIDYDLPASLRFSEYALELSKLDMYFPKNNALFNINLNTGGMQIFIFGFIAGAASAALVLINRKKKKHKNKSQK